MIEFAGRVGIMPLDQTSQIRNFVGVIGERVMPRASLQQKLRPLVGCVLERQIALHPEALRHAGEIRNRHAIVEHVVNPAQVMGPRFDIERSVEKALIVAVAWASIIRCSSNRTGVA
jgi:hypothetical protein